MLGVQSVLPLISDVMNGQPIAPPDPKGLAVFGPGELVVRVLNHEEGKTKRKDMGVAS